MGAAKGRCDTSRLGLQSLSAAMQAEQQLFWWSTGLCMRDFFVGEYSRVLRIFLLRAHRPPAVCDVVQQTKQRKNASKSDFATLSACLTKRNKRHTRCLTNGGIRATPYRRYFSLAAGSLAWGTSRPLTISKPNGRLPPP